MSDGTSDHSYRADLAREDGPIRGLITRYFRRRVSNAHDVEDLVQDVFARVLARNSDEPIENLGKYLTRTAANVLVDRARRSSARRAELHVAFDPDQHGGEEIDPERTLAAKQDLTAAMAALLSLPERTRNVFILYRLEGYRQREIADHLGISLSTVEKDMLRAIRHLSAEVEKHRAP